MKELLAVLAGILPPFSCGQDQPRPIRVIEPEGAPGWRSMDSAGDVDCDGFPDLVLGDCGDSRGGKNAGLVRVVSGHDFHLLFETLGSKPLELFGNHVWGIGDVNGDGVPDVAATFGDATSNKQSIRVLSGTNGSDLQLPLPMAFCLCSLGDSNHDGCSDILLLTAAVESGVPGKANDSWGSLEARSGRDGSLLYILKGESREERISGAISVGDLDGDGANEFVIRRGSEGFSLRSGRDGHEVLDLGGFSIRSQLLGWVNAGPAGDQDGDGTADFVLAREASAGVLQAQVLSGRDGRVLHRFEDRSGLLWCGSRIVTVGDVDGCGHPDWAIGAPSFETWDELNEDRGRMLLVSGGRATAMKSLRGEGAYSYFGNNVVGLGDVDGDGVPDVACTEQVWIERMNSSAHIVQIYSGANLR